MSPRNPLSLSPWFAQSPVQVFGMPMVQSAPSPVQQASVSAGLTTVEKSAKLAQAIAGGGGGATEPAAQL